MRKKPHLLKPVGTGNIPSSVLFFDVESLLEEKDDNITLHHFRLGVAKYVRFNPDGSIRNITTYRFTKQSSFWDIVKDRTLSKKPLYLVAHNVKYDIAVLRFYNYLPQMGYNLTSIYDKYQTTIMRFRRDKQSLVIMDNANIFPGKLEKWGKALNIPKLPMPPWGADNETWFTYCERDVEIMVRLWERWFQTLREYELGRWGITLASQAFNIFRHRFMKHKICIHNNEEAITLERQAYRGGRSQPFFIGKLNSGPYYKLDVNSMYPYVMRRYEYPTALGGIKGDIRLSELYARLKRYAVIANVTICTDTPLYPYKQGTRTVYPVGTFRTTLCTAELKEAVKRNHVLAVHKVVWYRTRRLFVDYIDFCYKRKLEAERSGNVAERQFWKLLMNALYGKFGQRSSTTKVIGTTDKIMFTTMPAKDVTTGERYLIHAIGKTLFRQVQESEGYNSFVAIAAEVTAYARVYLWRLIEQAGVHNVFYVDTDSLIVNQAGYLRLLHYLHDTNLGMLKVEGIADEIVLRAPKDYVFGKKERIKGVPSSAEQLDENVYRYEFWPGLKTLMRKLNGEDYWTEKRTKVLARDIRYGEVTKTGRIHPYTIFAP